MLTRLIKIQLVLFTILTIIALVALGWYYLRLPSLAGIGQYTLHADLKRSGGLYGTANVTYRGITIGKVTAVEPTKDGARVTMSIADSYKIPLDATANVHSVSAIGEQYLDLVSTSDRPAQFYSAGATIPVDNTSVPSEVGPALDSANAGLDALPKEQIDLLLDETSQAVAGLGPALQRLVDSTTLLAKDFRDNITPINDIVENSGPILNSQVVSGDAIDQWARNLNILGAQAAEQDAALRSGLQQAAPTAQAVEAVFAGTQESLPQTLANLSVIIDLLKRYNKNVEQLLVAFPQAGAAAQTGTILPNLGLLPLAISINQPAPCLTGFLPAPMWRSPADTSPMDPPQNVYCKIPKDYQGNAVRGARNYPCVDVPGKRAASPQECRSDQPYVPAGTNPWFGDPNQILTCPAPGARCDQPPKPGYVIPAPTVNSGLNPAPADHLPPPGMPAPISDPLSPPGTGSVRCSGQQPNQCTYIPNGPPADAANIFAPPSPPAGGVVPGPPVPPGLPLATYSPQSGQVVTPDGTQLSVTDAITGDDGWKDLLAPTN